MKITLRNRLDVLMKDSGIGTFEEMSERLTENQGWKISRSALSRKFRDDNVTLSMSMIEAICNELQCLPGDLFETNITDASSDDIDNIQSRIQPFRYGMIHKSKAKVESDISESEAKATERAKKKEDDDMSAILGPGVSHLHSAKVNKKD